MTPDRPTVCVIGGGISGLTVAHSLTSTTSAPHVVVLEASERLGGAIRTEVVDGVTVESGADSFLTRAPDAADLCADVGLGDDLISPAVFGATILRSPESPRLVAMPSDFVFGMPATPRAALRAPHLPRGARMRAALEPFVPGARIESDRAIGDVVRRRYGRGVLALSVDPLLAGTRAGEVFEMSLEAALPQVWGLVRGRRSFMRAFRAANAIPSGPPPFKSVAGGLERLIHALRDRCEGADFRTGVRVLSVEPAAEGFVVRTEGAEVECAAVVAATPAFESARLLRAANPEVSRVLESIEFASVATITYVFPPRAMRSAPPGSGLLVPSSSGLALSACTWYSIKWPHAAPSDGGIVVRSFVGRAGESDVLRMPDEDLIERVARETGRALGLTARPRTSHLTRWPRSLPQYRVGHVGTVDRIEAALRASPGIWVTGAAYRGSGIPDCIRHARAAADSVREWLGAVG